MPTCKDCTKYIRENSHFGYCTRVYGYQLKMEPDDRICPRYQEKTEMEKLAEQEDTE